MLSYNKAVSTVKRRIRRLRENKVENNALKVLEANLTTFYKKTGLKKRGRGITIDDRMSAKEKREMNDILRAFLKDKTSTLTGIKEEAKKLGYDGGSAAELAREVDDSMLVLINDQSIIDTLGSQVVHDIYTNQKERGYDPDVARAALSNVILHTDMSEQVSVQELTARVMENIEGLLEQGYDPDFEGEDFI